MPTYNAALYIGQAIESIINQTFTDFELLIYDDSSTDNTIDIIESFTDSRIQLFKKKNRTGYTKSLISGIDIAKGKYIARMDSDDISHTARLAKQVKFLEDNMEYGVVGSFVETINENNQSQIWKFPVEDVDIRLYCIINSPFAHPSVMIRKEVLVQNRLTYLSAYEPCEDYKLWIDLLKVTKGKNLPEVLLKYRLHHSQTISVSKNKLVEKSNLVRQQVMLDYFGIALEENELTRQYYFFNEIKANDAASIRAKYLWRKKLLGFFTKQQDITGIIELVDAYWVNNLRTLTEFHFSFLKFLFNKAVLSGMKFTGAFSFFIKCITGYKVSTSKN